jgi:Helix-turn-helix domain
MAGKHHPEHVKAEAIQRYLLGEPRQKICTALGISRFTLAEWIKDYDPARQPQPPDVYRRNVEQLGELIYDTVIATLDAIRARAIATGDPEWAKTQSASELAALDGAQWDRAIRMVSAFRPRSTAHADVDAEEDQAADGGGDFGQQQPGVHRNGAVDPAD